MSPNHHIRLILWPFVSSFSTQIFFSKFFYGSSVFLRKNSLKPNFIWFDNVWKTIFGEQFFQNTLIQLWFIIPAYEWIALMYVMLRMSFLLYWICILIHQTSSLLKKNFIYKIWRGKMFFQMLLSHPLLWQMFTMGSQPIFK